MLIVLTLYTFYTYSRVNTGIYTPEWVLLPSN